jgi:hypothetical protein
MKTFSMWKMMSFALIVSALLFAACDTNDTQDVKGSVDANASAIPSPAVEVKATDFGVVLAWNLIDDANSYTIFRKADGEGEIQIDTRNNGNVNKTTGKIYYQDFVSNDLNSVQPNTKYTYTVIATPVSGGRAHGKTSKSVTTGAFKEQGYKLVKPTDVSFTLDADKGVISGTITPSADNEAVSGYWIWFSRDNATYIQLNNNDNGVWVSYPNTAFQVEWTTGYQQDGTYTAYVSAGFGGDDGYYKSSDTIVSEEQKFENLFLSNASFYNNDTFPIYPAGTGRIDNYYASFSVRGLKEGVAYKIQRATVDKATGNTGDYADVSLKKPATSGFVDVQPADWELDLVGHPALDSFQDRSLPAIAAQYKYRLVATKGSQTQYKETSVSVNPLNEVYPEISVSKGTLANGNTPYTITARVSYTGLLGANDKLVVYYTGKTDASSKGYTNKLEFTKTQLETAGGTPQTINLPSAGSGTIYLQAQLEFADGTKRNVSYMSGDVYSYNTDSVSGNTIYGLD